ISFSAQALDVYEWTLDINTASKHENSHYGHNQTYNESNDGIGLSFGYSENIDIKLGYYDNSYHKTSIYTGFVLNKDYYIYNDFVISPGVGLMFATGYDKVVNNAPIIAPMLHPSISFGFRTLRSTIGTIPYSANKVITFQTQIQF
ncbi:MAG: hypothetical protein KTR20_13645, partial [Cellvibrionaceae bacterium]|nr:hypothetical protein [Cellvibrionaceae bacterium]